MRQGSADAFLLTEDFQIPDRFQAVYIFQIDISCIKRGPGIESKFEVTSNVIRMFCLRTFVEAFS